MLKVIKGRLTTVFLVGREEGFTIVELMIAAALSLIVMTGIYSVYHSQQKSYIVREQVTVMQQNLRAGMVVMTSDIRMAGYHHPTVNVSPGITEANAADLTFTLLADRSDEPDPTDLTLEKIKYSLTDKDGDGDQDLVKEVDDSGDPQIIAENIDALNFIYLKDDGTVTATLTEIKSIQVTMVARTGRGDRDYSDSTINEDYKNQQGDTIYTPSPDDNFRRRKLSREIRCRNL